MNILMLHQGRCGSTVLGDLLSQHPALHWDGEIYYTSNWMPPSQPIEEIVFPGDGLRLVQDRMADVARTRGPLSYGFEVQTQCIVPMHISIADYVSRCAELGFTHFIHLQRRNLLRKVVSSVVALARNQFHFRPWEIPPLTKVEISIKHLALKNTVQPLLTFMEGMESKMAEIDAAIVGKNALDIVYEDDIEFGPHSGYKRVCAFLGIVPASPAIHYAPATPRPMYETIENWSEVCRALSGTKYEWMLRG